VPPVRVIDVAPRPRPPFPCPADRAGRADEALSRTLGLRPQARNGWWPAGTLPRGAAALGTELLRTIEPPTRPDGSPPPGSRRQGAVALGAGLLVAPLLVLTVLTRWGVLIAVLVALVVGIGLWVRRRSFLFIELVAFLIHFDGLGYGPVRTGRIVAGAALVVLLHKLFVERWRPPAVPVRHWIFPAVLATWAVATGAWSDRVSAWFFAMGLLGLALAYFFVTALMVDSHTKIQRYLRAYWFGGLWGSGAGVIALFLGTRSQGLGGDPNFFGLLQASMIPLTVYYRRNESDPVRRRWYTLALLLVFAGAAGAGSRSGIIGACVAIVATMVTKPRLSAGQRMRTAVGALVVGAMAFAVLFVANPANLSRGFSDRGAGRLDFWATTMLLIGERPILGQGFGQTAFEIPLSLAVTPGVQALTEVRESVSAHNTYLDILADLGLPGLLAWVGLFVVTFSGYLRPRWPHTRELSTTLCVMLLPVMSSSQFLPLFNNKLAWSLIGLSAALQVPSRATRWTGFARDTLPADSSRAGVALPRAGRALARPDGSARPPGRPDGMRALPLALLRPPPSEQHQWEEPTLARWDLRISQRFRWSVVAGAVAGAVLFGTLSSLLPDRYAATAAFVVPKLDTPERFRRVAIDRTRVQVIHTLLTSGAYAAELGRLSGIDLSPAEIRQRLDVERPRYGAFLEVNYVDTDPQRVAAVLPHLVEALDATVVAGRNLSDPVLDDEVRPALPGESRVYRGPLYLPVSEESTFDERPRRTVWTVFVGTLAGAMAAMSFVLVQQRRPRVNNDDDLPDVVRLPVWAHVGRAGRGHGATYEQYAQVATALGAASGDADWPRHVLVTTPRSDRAARMLALGVAAAMSTAGRQTVLVDAQVDRPMLSRRLGGARRPGLLDAGAGRVDPHDVTLPVRRWRMPLSVRRWARTSDGLRFVPAGRRHGGSDEVRTAPLLSFGDDVTVVTLVPALVGDRPAAHLLQSADAVVLALVEGRTVTFDAEDAALVVRTFAAAPAGIVVLDV
jgi:O-antigen ligase